MTTEQTKLIDDIDRILFTLIQKVPKGREFEDLLRSLKFARSMSLFLLPAKNKEEGK